MDDCIFCKIVSGELSCLPIYEDDYVLSFLDIGPISKGHTLVIPKDHFATFSEMPADQAAAVGSALTEIAPAVQSAMNADGYNLLLANGACAGQVVFHVHFHIIPRHNTDKLKMGWKHATYAKGVAEEVHKAIVNEIGQDG